MKTYRARSFGAAFVIDERGARSLPPRLDLLGLSPGGFTWGGYGTGLGGQQLAFAILCDAFDEATAHRLYRQFDAAAIAKRPKDEQFEITKDEVMAAVGAIEP